MSVKLETGMFGITRGGKRVGPVAYVHNVFVVGGYPYQENGLVFSNDSDKEMDIDIVVAGFKWDDLKPQIGDRLMRVHNDEGYPVAEVVVKEDCASLKGGLYTVVSKVDTFVAPSVVPPETAIEWGDWVEGLVNAQNGEPMELYFDGAVYHHRFPKPKGPEVKSINRYVSAFGRTNRLKLTSTDGVISVELLPMRAA